MGLRINTNVASIQAQNSLNKTSKKLNQALTRLSTGLRINSGKDDVVGLANSEALRSQIRGAGVARTNITSASAVLGVAEGYLSQLTEIAQSMRDLAVQASDDTISVASRDSISASMTSLMDEYNRLANSANFNGTKLIDGTFTGKAIQAGTNEGDTISLTIDDARSSTIGKIAILTAQARTGTLTTVVLTNLDFNQAGPSSINISGDPLSNTVGVDFVDDGVSNAKATESAIAYVRAINAHTTTTGVSASVLANVVTGDYTTQALSGSYHMLINGVTVKNDAISYGSNDNDIASLVQLINAHSSETGVVATQNATTNKLILTASDGRNIDVAIANAGVANTNVYSLTGAATNQSVVFRSTFKLTSDDVFTVSNASLEFTDAATKSVSLSNSTTLSNVAVDTAANSGTSISILDKVIEQLQTRRASVGNVVNRLDISEAELASRLENLNSAESVIRDADVAAETAKFTLYNVLQQIGATVLAQANAAPQIALTLLQNL